LHFLGFAGDVTSHRGCRKGEEEKMTQIHPSLRLCPRRRVEKTRRHCSGGSEDFLAVFPDF